jgi:putative ABC transport system substrate-binding protein
MMKRREFITLLAAVACPLGARAQQARVPAIGWLGGGTPATQSQWAVAFTERLRQLGWSEGSSIAIEYRWAEGRPERFAEIAAEFVRLKVDVILAAGTEAALAAKNVTAIIPIVFPVAGETCASLTQPATASSAGLGGNMQHGPAPEHAALGPHHAARQPLHV